MKIIGLIPVRLSSKRLKHKPLLNIDGLPIIVHTFKRAMLSNKLDRVIVCCDDKKIYDVVSKYGGEAILTSKNHKNGTERIFEVAKKFKPKYVVDVQGDEPFVDPKDIDRVIDFHKKKSLFDIIVPSMKEAKEMDRFRQETLFEAMPELGEIDELVYAYENAETLEEPDPAKVGNFAQGEGTVE